VNYDITLTDVAPTWLASSRKHVTWAEVPKTIIPLLDGVYAFLRTAAVRPQGHNVCVYHAPSAEGVDLEAGVQVSGPFESTGDVRCSQTPAGRAVRTVHVGEYAQLGAAYDALAAWGKAHGLPQRRLGWRSTAIGTTIRRNGPRRCFSSSPPTYESSKTAMCRAVRADSPLPSC